MIRIASLLPLSLALSACGQQAGNNSAGPAADVQPGGVPSPVAGTVRADALIYPGSTRTAEGFSTSDPPDRVVTHYWDESQPLKQRGELMWAVSQPEKRDGGGYLIHLTLMKGDDGQVYLVYLTPSGSGGTNGRVRPISDEEVKSGFKL